MARSGRVPGVLNYTPYARALGVVRRKCEEEMSKPQDRFKQEIIYLSKADIWENARAEWDLFDIYYEYDGTCLCGKHPITEHCEMHNRVTGAETVVGNECVKKFFKVKADSAFRVLKTVREDAYCTLNGHVVSEAQRYGFITSRECHFYNDVRGKSIERLTDKQKAWKFTINKNLARFASKHPTKVAKPKSTPAETRPHLTFYHFGNGRVEVR